MAIILQPMYVVQQQVIVMSQNGVLEQVVHVLWIHSQLQGLHVELQQETVM
jgi:hypothetical protein